MTKEGLPVLGGRPYNTFTPQKAAGGESVGRVQWPVNLAPTGGVGLAGLFFLTRYLGVVLDRYTPSHAVWSSCIGNMVP